VKFGISFTTRFLNQGNALVIVHRDGSVQVSTGATEMGQGVNARIANLVASELGLKMSCVRMMPTSTEKNANTSPTAASSGTDLNGGAAILAARKIKARLSQVAKILFQLPTERWARVTAGLGTEEEIQIDPEVYRQLQYGDDANADASASSAAEYLGVIFQDGEVFLKSNPSRRLKFSDVTNEAYLNRVSLSDYAHYRIPHLHFNKLTGVGQAFMYYTQGAAVSEVSVNKHTGEVKVQDVQILMDLGRPVMKELDLGQVCGAFIQGMGWVTTENLVYSAQGKLLSHSPSTYKIPSIQDMPRKFHIELFQNEGNIHNVRGTKAAGEPPLLLALSVWTAIQDALKSAVKAYPSLPIPATQEQILKVLYPDQFSNK
jgi:xanthine dehydrogenase large subunit